MATFARTMHASELILLFCEDWFVHMYNPADNRTYVYNSEMDSIWATLSQEACDDRDAVKKHILPVVLAEDRMLRYSGCIYNVDTNEFVDEET